MRKLLFGTMVGIGLSVSAVAASSDNAIVRLKMLDQEQRDRAMRGDPSFEKQYYAEDIEAITSAGALRDKAGSIAALATPGLKLDGIDASEVRARRYGDVVILSGRSRLRGSFNGVPFDRESRYVRVWHKRKNGWQLVHFQETPIAAPQR